MITGVYESSRMTRHTNEKAEPVIVKTVEPQMVLKYSGNDGGHGKQLPPHGHYESIKVKSEDNNPGR
jgi:hypothetical protein